MKIIKITVVQIRLIALICNSLNQSLKLHLYFEKGKQKDSRNYRQFILSPWDGYAANLPRSYFKRYERQMSRNSPQKFIKYKSWLINEISVYNEMPSFVEKKRGINVYFHLNKAFDITSHSTLVAKLVRYILGECTA